MPTNAPDRSTIRRALGGACLAQASPAHAFPNYTFTPISDPNGKPSGDANGLYNAS